MDMRTLLRGIGVGLIAAVMVTSVPRMITRQQGGDTLFSRPSEAPGETETAVPQSGEKPGASETPKESAAPEVSQAPKESTAPEASQAPEESAAPKESTTPEAGQTPEKNEKPAASPAPKVSETPSKSEPSETGSSQSDQTQLSDQEVYTLRITPGMESYHVAKALAKEGIVPDTQSFNKYLSEKPVSENMQVGSYDIPYTATYDQIVEILEGKTTAEAILRGGSK